MARPGAGSKHSGAVLADQQLGWKRKVDSLRGGTYSQKLGGTRSEFSQGSEDSDKLPAISDYPDPSAEQQAWSFTSQSKQDSKWIRSQHGCGQ